MRVSRPRIRKRQARKPPARLAHKGQRRVNASRERFAEKENAVRRRGECSPYTKRAAKPALIVADARVHSIGINREKRERFTVAVLSVGCVPGFSFHFTSPERRPAFPSNQARPTDATAPRGLPLSGRLSEKRPAPSSGKSSKRSALLRPSLFFRTGFAL